VRASNHCRRTSGASSPAALVAENKFDNQSAEKIQKMRRCINAHKLNHDRAAVTGDGI
jgi:hypothetical protein